MLMTARPELLPIDLKRQGRAEVHIPLFYPQDEAEITEMFKVLAKKNKLALESDAIPAIQPNQFLSGADIESVVLTAKRQMLTDGRSVATRSDIELAFREFIPSAQGLEKEYQELASVLECTQMSFLPPEWRAKVSALEGRARLQERMSKIRVLLD
ncbi:MAG: AAA family ATPase, partial [Planctomycetota bacterium]|nr:AAA family ATPase [Planctomycetota bacterium]